MKYQTLFLDADETLLDFKRADAALLLWLAPDSVWLSFLIAEAITCVATLLLYRRTVRPLIAALADSDSSR